MDYKEVTKKDGKILVFCNFEELLCEAYNVKSIEEAECFLNSTDEYIIQCPLCKHEHTKHKLYIKGDLTVGNCFLCNRIYINVTDDINVQVQVPKFSNFWGSPAFELPVMKDPNWQIDTFLYEFDDFDEKGYNYLLSRHGFMKDLYKVLGFKFVDGNVAMPFYYRGEVVYYQIRFSTKDSRIRYFFPPVTNKIPYTINHDIGPDTRLIFCEGIYDAIACLIMAPQFIPVALLGKTITDYQIEFIKNEYFPLKEIVVFMDKTEISRDVARKLKQNLYAPISIIKSTGDDPEEFMKRKLSYGQELQWIKPRVE